MDSAYVERSNGRFEVWTYADGRRYLLCYRATLAAAHDWAKRNKYSLVEV